MNFASGIYIAFTFLSLAAGLECGIQHVVAYSEMS